MNHHREKVISFLEDMNDIHQSDWYVLDCCFITYIYQKTKEVKHIDCNKEIP